MRTDDPDKTGKVMAYTARAQVRLKEAAGPFVHSETAIPGGARRTEFQP